METEEIREKMRQAYRLAEASPDTSTKLGAIYCERSEEDFGFGGWWNVAFGVNQFVEGFGTLPGDNERPFKYSITEHAERNCLFAAARKRHFPLEGVMVCNWVACPDCARAIVAAGVREVICHHECQQRTPDRWVELVNTGLLILKRGGVKLTEWSGKVGDIKNLNNSEIWEP